MLIQSTIPIATVKVLNRRPVNPDKVKELVSSISEIGLLNPITVRFNEDTGQYVLVAGYHRLEAVKLLDWSEIPVCVIPVNGLIAELAEIDENLIREELHYIDRGNQLLRRKEIYEELYPGTEHGGDRGNQYTGGKSRIPALAKPSFVKDTSIKTGRSQTTIKEEVQGCISDLKQVFLRSVFPNSSFPLKRFYMRLQAHFFV